VAGGLHLVAALAQVGGKGFQGVRGIPQVVRPDREPVHHISRCSCQSAQVTAAVVPPPDEPPPTGLASCCSAFCTPVPKPDDAAEPTAPRSTPLCVPSASPSNCPAISDAALSSAAKMGPSTTLMSCCSTDLTAWSKIRLRTCSVTSVSAGMAASDAPKVNGAAAW